MPDMPDPPGFVATAKGALGVTREALIVVMFLLLILWPSAFNGVLERAGFTKGSLMGFEWQKELKDSTEQAKGAGDAITQIQARLQGMEKSLEGATGPDAAALKAQVRALVQDTQKADQATMNSLATQQRLIAQAAPAALETSGWIYVGKTVRRVCRLLAREGVDLLKLNLSGDIGTSSFPSEQTPMTDAEVAAAMEVARAAELRVAAHCRSAESVMMALRHGIEVIYHANWADERALDALEAARDRVFVGPALGITYNLSQANGQWGVPTERSRAFERELEVSIETVARMRKRGIRVLPGGDYGFTYTPHGTYARDLWIFVKLLGFSPMETIEAATRLGGEIMGLAGTLGVVKPGALADLLLVDGDPLADIAILQDRSALRMIMKDGALHKGP